MVKENLLPDIKEVRCLIISHAFNMDGRAASQTVTDKIPSLCSRRWKLYALSATTGMRDYRLPHYQVFASGPAGFRFDLRHWCAVRWGRGIRYRLATTLASLILLPFIGLERIIVGLSSQWSWAISAILYGLILIRRHHINVIYSSGGAWSAHLSGWWLKHLTRTVWIAEIHDPLVERTSSTDLGISPRNTREGRFKQKLERMICERSDLCWWFTDGAIKFARLRNPQLGEKGFVVLPGALPPRIRVQYRIQNQLRISHFGSLSSSRSIASIIYAIAKLHAVHPNSTGKIILTIYGGSIDLDSHTAILKTGLHDVVQLFGRVESNADSQMSGRDQITRQMQLSDYLLLLHGNSEVCSEYIPSKLYEYWWANRPIIGIVYKNSQLVELLRSISQQNIIVDAASGDKSIVKALELAWLNWLSKDVAQYRQQTAPLRPDDAVAIMENKLTFVK